MRKSVVFLILATLAFYSCGQNRKAASEKVIPTVKTVASTPTNKGGIKTAGFAKGSHIYTEADYTDATGKGIIIQNSLPRGGAFTISANEKTYGYAVFWSRIVNKEDTTVELTLNFPSDSIIFVPASKVHFKLLAPPDTMTAEKVSAFNFGLEGIQTFVDKNFNQPSQIHRTIQPNEDCIFYIILLSHLSPTDKGVTRTGLFLDGHDLFYTLNDMDSLNDKSIPCGRISYKK